MSHTDDAKSPIALLGSVFLPASVFEPLAGELRARGHDVTIASADRATTPDEALEAYVAAVGGRHGIIGVAHSNAGSFIPALSGRGHLDAAVFMDAMLPPAEGGRLPVVHDDQRTALRAMAVDGALPPWTEWWPADAVQALFPDPETYAEVHRATPRVPIGYLDGSADVPAGWTARLRAAYLAFGDTYADERRRAESLGWPTRTMPLGHLGHLQQPAAVARELLELIGTITAPGRPGATPRADGPPS